MKKILVPTDFSKQAQIAIDVAIEMNKVLKGTLHLLHVLELPATSISYDGDTSTPSEDTIYTRELIKGCSEKLREQKNYIESKNQQVAIKLEYGSPYKSIGKEISEEKPDWVIMGSSGASGLSEFFLGSNAERVIRFSQCPVMIVKKPINLQNIKSMVFASDLSEEQDAFVVKRVKKLQKDFNLNVHIVKVISHFRPISNQDAKEKVKQFAQRNNFENYTANVVDSDFADEGIVNFATEINAGLIVMGTHARKGIAHLFGGSRAEDVANLSTLPVITIKIQK